MEELDYTDPLVDKSTDNSSKDAYVSNPVAEESIARLKRQAKNRDAQLQRLQDQQDAEDSRQQDLIDNPDPFMDDSDYFGLITSGQIGDSLDSIDTLGRNINLKNRDYYWDNDKVKAQFIEKYGEDDAEDMFDVIYEEVDKQYYNHIAKHSLLNTAGLNTAIFVDEMNNRGGYDDYSSKAMALSGMIGYQPDNAISVEEVYQNRGTEFFGDFYTSERSSKQMSLDFYKDPETGQVKQLTPERIEELENRDDFVAFKYNNNYLALDDRSRGDRYVTIQREGDELLASDQLVSSWDLGGGFLSNNARENDWYKTILMAIPKFGTELTIGSIEAVNNIAMVGSALLGGDSFTGSEWETWLTKNEGWLRAHKISKTDEALTNPYTSLDGLTDLFVNVTSQFAAAYLTGNAIGWVARGAMGYYGANGARAAVADLGKARKFVEAVQAGKKAGAIAATAGKAGNIAGKALMTSMAMGDIYQVGKESGLSPREAASVASLAYGGLWIVLNLSENIWKPFDLKKVQKQFINITRDNLKNVQSTLDAVYIAAEKEAVKKNLTGLAKASFIKRMKDKVIANTSRNIVIKMGAKLRTMAPKLTIAGRDAFNEALEESSELLYQESLKNSYNMVSELWHEEERKRGTGKFFGATDDEYFTVKMDELIQSFIGGFLGGGFMGAGKAAFKTEPQIKSTADLVVAGKMDQYVKVINDAFKQKDARIFAAHEYTMTTRKREEGDKGKGKFMRVDEVPDAKSIAEIKRDLLLEEVNHLQTSMDIDGIKPDKLQEKIDSDKGFRTPTIINEYSDELAKYIAALDERESIKSNQLANTDKAIASSSEEAAQQSAITQKAMEDSPSKLEAIDLEIQGYVKNMDNIANGVTILNIVKNKKLEEYDNLNDNNNLTHNKSLFDNLNAAQASEKIKEDGRRKQRVERAKNLHTVIQASLDNLNKLGTIIEKSDREETEDGVIDYGIKYLYEKDKKSIIKELKKRRLTSPQIMSSGTFEEDVRKTAGAIIDESYDRQEINKEFNIDPDSQDSKNMNLFLSALKNKRIDKIVNAIKTNKEGDIVFEKLSNIDPLVMVGENATKERLDRLDKNMEESIKNNKDEGSMLAYVDSLYTKLDVMINMGDDILETVSGQFTEINDLYKDSFDNSQINSIIRTLNTIKNVDDQEGDLHISEIIDKHISINGNDYFINPDKEIEDLVNNEAKDYQESALSGRSNVYTYKDSGPAKSAINHFDAQIESMQLTAEFAGSQAIIDARLRSAQIRKGVIDATTVGLVINKEIKDSYDSFEDFFSTMYFDPLRLEQLRNKKNNGSINSSEVEELTDIENYLKAELVTSAINNILVSEAYDPNYTEKIIQILKEIEVIDEFKIDISKAEFSLLSSKAILKDSSGKITDGTIPYGNKAFSEELRKVLPAPIGQYINLLRAKNDMKFFVENAEHNKNIGDVGLTLKKQNKTYTDSLRVYNEFLYPELTSADPGIYTLTAEFKDKLAIINGEMIRVLMSEEGPTKESIADKFNVERDFLKLLSTIEHVPTKVAIIDSLRNKIGTGIVSKRYNNLEVKEALGIIGEVMIALEYNVDNFFSTYKDLLQKNDISKLTTGTPDALQEKAALMVAGFLGSDASNNTDLRFVSYLEGGLATGKSTYALGIGLRVHQMNNPGSKILLAANNSLQIENIKATSKNFQLETYDLDTEYDLPTLVTKLEKEANIEDGGKLLKGVDVIVYDEATMIDAKTILNSKETPDNFFRIIAAIENINKLRPKDAPKLKLLLVGDSNQNGFESGEVRIGKQYSEDEKLLKSGNYSKTAFQYNIGNYGLFGVAGSPSLIRSRNLEAQYRSVSAEIPITVRDIKDFNVVGSTSMVEDFSLTTKYGYSETEKKFLGVNVKTTFEDFTTNEEYLNYIETRIKNSTPDNIFTVGIASSKFSFKDSLGNMKALTSSSKLYSLVEAHPNNFILGTHSELQGSSYSLMVVDMDKRSFTANTDRVDKSNDQRTLYTSVGRGIEHVVIITNDKYTNIVAGHRDNTVKTNSVGVIQEVVNETRDFTISKLKNISPSSDIIKPIIPLDPVVLEPVDSEGWTTLPNNDVNIKKQQKVLGNSLLVRTYYPDREDPIYHHYTSIGIAVDDTGTIVDVDIKFEVEGEENLIEIDGIYLPANELGNYDQSGTIIFSEIDPNGNKEIEKPLIDYLSIRDIEGNIKEILKTYNYQIEEDAIEDVFDAQGNLISTRFASGYTSKKLPTPIFTHDDAPFKTKGEATKAQEDISKTTSLKNRIFDKDGAVSINKWIGDNVFGYQSYHSYASGNILSNKALSQEEKNYLMSEEYNKEVRKRLKNVNNYTYKLMLVSNDTNETTAHVVSYENGKKPLVVGNFIQNNSEDSDYEIVKILQKHIAFFDKDIAAKSDDIKSVVSKVGPKFKQKDVIPDELIYKYRLFDYKGRISERELTAGSVIDIHNISKSTDLNSVQEAIQIIKYDPAYKSIRSQIIDEHGEYIENSLESLKIPIQTLITSLKNKEIHVAKELLIQINTASHNVGNSRLLFNQIADKPMKTSSVIDRDSRLLRTRIGDGMNGLRQGWGLINLHNVGFTLTEALEMLGVNEDMKFNDVMTRTRTVEMIELFSTIGKVLAETIPDGKSTSMYDNLLDVNNNIRNYYPVTSIGETSEIFTGDNLNALKENIENLYKNEEQRPFLIELHKVILNMFHSNNLGSFKRNLKKTTAGTNGRDYIGDTSNKNAPIKYIIPEEKYIDVHMPAINFSINNLFKYLESFNSSSDSEVKLFSVKNLVKIFDSILKGSKFTNGIYLSLDKIENKKTGSYTYNAIAQENKIEGKDNLDLFYSTTIGLSNPNLVLPLEKIAFSLESDIKKEESLEKDIKTTLEELKTSFNNLFLKTLEESVIKSEKVYRMVTLKGMKESVIDHIYMTYFDSMVSNYESDFGNFIGGDIDIEVKIKYIKDLIYKRATQIDNPTNNTEDDVLILKELNISSLEDIVTVWDKDIKEYTEDSKKTSSSFIILGEGYEIIQDEVSLDLFVGEAKATATSIFPTEIAEQIHILIDNKKNIIKANLQVGNQLSPLERLDAALVLRYLDTLNTPSPGLSIQKILLNIKTIDFELHGMAGSINISTEEELLIEKTEKLEQLSKIPEGSVIDSKGKITYAGNTVTTIKDFKLRYKKAWDIIANLNQKVIFGSVTKQERNDIIKNLTPKIIQQAKLDLNDEYDEKINNESHKPFTSSDNKVESKLDKYGDIYYVNKKANKDGVKGKKTFGAKVSKYALENMVSNKSISIPEHILHPSLTDGEIILEIIEKGENPYELSMAYISAIETKPGPHGKDKIIVDHGLKIPIKVWMDTMLLKTQEDIPKEIQKNYIDFTGKKSTLDVDTENMSVNEGFDISIQDIIDHALEYPNKTGYDKERLSNITDLEIKIKSLWGVNITKSIADKVNEKYWEYQKTKKGNVVLNPVYQKEGADYAKSIDGVFSLRLNYTNNHFGNPASGSGKTGKGIELVFNSVKEAVQAYRDWLTTDKYDNLSQELLERKQWILAVIRSGILKGKPIIYYKELGEMSHANVLDELINGDPIINEINQDVQKEIAELTVKKNKFMEALKEKAPEPVPFEELVEKNWMYEGISLEAVKTKYKEKYKETDDDAKKESLTKQFKARVDTFGDEKSFEASLKGEMVKNPDLDIYEFAKGKEKNSDQASYIRSIIPHIEAFLLSNIDNVANNRINFIKKFETLIKSDNSDASKALIKSHILDITGKIKYIKKLPIFGSVSINKVVSTNIYALESLIDDLQNIMVDEQYKIPNDNIFIDGNTTGIIYTSEEYNDTRSILINILKEDEKLIEEFNKLVSFNATGETSSQLIIDIENFLEGKDESSEILENLLIFITDLNSYNINCK